MTMKLLGPNGSSGVSLSNPNNLEKTVDAGDLASDAYLKTRIGTAGDLTFRNKIVDGKFDFWTLNYFTQTTSGYGSDMMWFNLNDGSTKTHSRQTLVAGVDLPSVSVPTIKYFSRTAVTSVAGSANRVVKLIRLADVSNLAGKTATLSFYAKADTTRNIAIELVQNFGTGGTPSADVNTIGSQLVALTSTWQRYSRTITIPTISGKTLGTNSNDHLSVNFWFDAGSSFNTRTANLGQQSGTFDITGVQLEEGSVATVFEELPYSVSKNLVDYYIQYIHIAGEYPITYATTTSVRIANFQRTSPMRATPTTTIDTVQTNTFRTVSQANVTKVTASAITLGNNLGICFNATGTLTAYTWAAGDYVFADLFIQSDARL